MEANKHSWLLTLLYRARVYTVVRKPYVPSRVAGTLISCVYTEVVSSLLWKCVIVNGLVL